MRAVVVREAGGPEVLSVEEIAKPSPRSDEVLVRVEAAGLNYIDTYHRGGLYPMQMPLTPGREGAGVIEAVGETVTGFRPGQRVGWVDALGSYAEWISIPAGAAIPLPDDVDTSLAAAVLLQGITAHYLAIDTFPLTTGDKCLIHAAAGGVGLLLTQIAKMRGAEVFATVGTKEKANLSRDAGADHVIVYTEADFKEAVEAISGPKSIDVVYDGVGKATFEKGLGLLRPRGLMVSFGNASGPPPELSPLVLMRKGSIYLTRPTMGDYMRTPDETLGRVDDLFAWIASGALSVRIGAEFPLEQAADAHRALEGRATTGKVLIRP